MDWFRWWHGSVTDPKLQRVARMAGATVGEVIAVWACVLERASSVTTGDAGVTQGNKPVTRGDVVGFDCDDHDVLLGFADGKTAQIFAALSDRGLIEQGRIARWDERQPKREDSSTARTREWRERNKPAAKATPGDAPVTHGDAPEKSRGDKSNNPPNPPDGGKAPAKPKPEKAAAPAEKSTRAKPKRALPLPFLMTGAMLAWAADSVPLVNLDRETERFIDYWTGEGKSKADWDATWRNWMRRAQDNAERGGPRPPGGVVNRQQQIEDSNNAVVREIAERERQRREAGGAAPKGDFIDTGETIIEGEYEHAR